MASLPRGLFHPTLRPLSHLRPILAEIPSSSPRSRLFTTTFLRRASPPPKINPTPSRSAKEPPTPRTPQSNYALVKSLATKQTPTVLYESAPNFWFIFGCWTSGLSILAWAGLTGPTVVFQPEGVGEWVGWVFGSAYVLLAAMGFYLISKTPRLVKTIRVLPSAAPRAAPIPAPVAAPATTAPSLRMEVTVQRMVPFLKPKVLTTDIENVSLKSRLSLPEGYVPELRRRDLQRRAEKTAKELRQHDMNHLMTMPFRRLGRGLRGLFDGVRAAFTDMGYGVIRVDGREYKVNALKGFAHDGFKTLERLVTIKAK